MTRFGTHIKQSREDLGLSQAAVAERIGITPAGLSHIEVGTRTTTIKTARALCAVLGIGAPWPAVAFMEDNAAKYAREFGLTFEEAAAELARDFERAHAEFAETGKAEGPSRLLDQPNHPLRYRLSATNPNEDAA